MKRSSRSAIRAAMVLAVVAFGSVSSSRLAAASSFPSTPAGECASQTTDAPDDASALAFCTDLVQDLSDIGHRLGLPIITPTSSSLTSPVRVMFSSGPGSTADTALTTFMFQRFPGAPEQPCRIVAYPPSYGGQLSAAGVTPHLHVQLAHEVVHCYQNEVALENAKGLLSSNGLPDWVSDGSATYLATLYARNGESNTPGAWKRWIGGSDTADETEGLTLRGYDAIGWHSLVAHVTGDLLWSKMADAWRAYLAGGASAYIAALGGDSAAVAEAWAPSVLNMPTWGDAWTTPSAPGVDVPPGLKPTEFIGLTAGTGSDRKQIAPLSAVVDDESDIHDALIEVSVSDGYASVHDAAGYSDLDFQDAFFCLGTGCKTTEVTCAGAKKPFKPIELTAPFVVAAGGGANAATYEISKIPQPAVGSAKLAAPASAGPCRPQVPSGSDQGTGISAGDPHLLTLTGGEYDFQAAGEFTLVRSANARVQVQVRQDPIRNSTTVATNTAVAMRVGESTIEVDRGIPAPIFLDGKRVAFPASGTRALPGGGKLFVHRTSSDPTNVIATWPDGSRAEVVTDPLSVTVLFKPPPSEVDHFDGLLAATSSSGKKTGAHSGQMVLLGGNGQRYLYAPDTRAGFKALYGAFAGSWRVTNETSLFTYPTGKTTASYVVAGFPANEPSFATLPQRQKTTALRVCGAAKITDGRLLKDCEFDVGATGSATFAATTARVQEALAEQNAASRGPSTPTVPAGSTHPAGYYFTHPCEALTEPEIAAALGHSYPTSLAGLGVCDIATHPTGLNFPDHIFFSNLSIAQAKIVDNARLEGTPVAGLGGGAYCITTHLPGATESRVVATLGSIGSLSAVAGSCEEGSALVNAALSHISGA